MAGWTETSVACPGCRAHFFLGEYPGVNLHACCACGGAWLDNAGCKHIADATLPEDVSEAARAFDARAGAAAGRYREAARPDGHPRACPWCQAQLARVVISGIELDACAKHGTYFDRRELFALSQAIAIKAGEDDAFVKAFKGAVIGAGPRR